MNAITSVSVSNAALPATYASAKQALAACASLDECQDWADKAAALASYAKQAADDEMLRMATRIRDRAIRRAGELLKQIEPSKGGRPSETRGDAPPSFPSRKDAATQAGLSADQMKQAIRVANIPAADFERQVESDNPPTVTALAEQGKRPAPRPAIDLRGRNPNDFNRALHFVAELETYAQTAKAFNLDAILPILTPDEIADVRRYVAAIDAIHDRIITRI